MNRTEMEIRTKEYWICLQYEPLCVESSEAFVHDDTCGSVLSFSGRTRNIFEEKRVVQLTYECYVPMALKEMEKIALTMIKNYAPIRIAMVHRLGDVGIGETSVIISVATTHRVASYDASRYAIDTLKKQVPIFKKEIYEGGSTWKANKH